MKNIVLTAIVCAAPLPIWAQELTYGEFSASGSYTDIPVDGSDGQFVTTARGELGARIGNLDVWVEGVSNRLDNDEIPSLEFRDASFGGRYNFAKNVALDLSYNNVSVGLGEGAASGSFYEIGVGYENEQLFGRVSYSMFNDSLIGLDALYGVQAGYKISPNTIASISAHFVDEDSNTVDEPLYIASVTHSSARYRIEAEYLALEVSENNGKLETDLLNLRGEYDFNSKTYLRMGYSYGNLSLSDPNDQDELDAHRVALGGGYRFTDSLNAYADVTWTELSEESSSTGPFPSSSSGSEDGFGITFGVEYKFGNKGSNLETTRDRLDKAIRGINGL